ncbi:uncharacterized protein C8R40DRAFT_1170977 [Lentinula edodes]|uniref:uncharacterized protein n=1 Tax=Lentinula edodes TaxID=5353 RepID=UPI001E8CACB4|nr:uncharacterized protein C8R40DRAFT_1170977 [Lentinula edodes]KAH7874868.1 hypothetical protein C8R40DRAFT_1170977 [Lentinula edodes]
MLNVMTGRRPLPPIFLFICIFLCELSLVSSTAVNRSIDDTLGDSVTGVRPTYLPDTTGVWEDNTCSGCALVPDISSAFDGTYTAATYNPELKNISISFDFIGTAIYIFFILSNDPNPGISTSTLANFTLDGTLVSTFSHSPNSSSSAPSFYFNESALAFSETGMKNSSHQMVISTSGLSSNYWLNFDYALYTFQRPDTTTSSVSSSSSSSSSSASSTTDYSSSQSDSKTVSAGAIAGGVIGGVAALAIVAVVWFFCQRRTKSEDNDYHNDDPNTVLQREIDPFILPLAVDSTHPNDSSRPSSTFRTSTALLQRTTTGISEGVPRTSSTIPPPLPLDSKSAIRRQRQQDLERQMQQITDEIKDLQIEAAERNDGRDPTMSSSISAPGRSLSSVARSRSMRSPRSADGKEDVSQLKAQIQAMSEHIAYLQDQQNSAWAQGLSDEPPPGYSPGPVDGHAVIS